MADKFDEATQKELQTFLEKEQAQMKLHQKVFELTSTCWDKCITGTPSTRFSRSEEGCLANCVERFIDTSKFFVQKLEEQRALSGL